MTEREMRCRVLRMTYDASNSHRLPMADAGYVHELPGEADLSEGPTGEVLRLRVSNALQYLSDSGFIVCATLPHGDSQIPNRMVTQITSRGVDCVEGRRSESGPPRFTSVFLGPTNIGAQQFGDGNTANVTQNIGADVQPLLEALLEMHRETAGNPSLSAINALVDSAVVEVKAHGISERLTGMLGGISQLVQTAGAATPAYGLLYAAATSAGLHLPPPSGTP